MNTYEQINNVSEQRNALSAALLRNGVSLRNIINDIGADYSDEFVRRTFRMTCLLQTAYTTLRLTRDMNMTVKVLADAKLQKDNVYCIFPEAYGAEVETLPTNPRVKLLSGSALLAHPPYMNAVMHYLKGTYDQGVARCEQWIGAQLQ